VNQADIAGQQRPTRAARLRVHAALLAWSTILLVIVSLVHRPDRHGDREAAQADTRLESKSGPQTWESRR
jgi:hypothetical protein